MDQVQGMDLRIRNRNCEDVGIFSDDLDSRKTYFQSSLQMENDINRTIISRDSCYINLISGYIEVFPNFNYFSSLNSLNVQLLCLINDVTSLIRYDLFDM